jgi:hypothetical protein
MDTRRLRAAIFERSGIAIDEHDPIMAVVAASAQQTEEIGQLLLRRASPARFAAALTVSAAVFAAAGTWAGWVLAKQRFEVERAEWLRRQNDPRMTELLQSEQGRAGVRLAELGVAALLANCNGRRSWRVQDGYCIPVTPQGLPDGFRVPETRAPRDAGA